MNNFITLLMVFILILPNSMYAQSPADICESKIPNGWFANNGTLKVTDERFKTGRASILWKWNNTNATLEIKDTAFSTVYKNPRAGFIVWIYNEVPVNHELKFEFRNGSKICTSFSFGLNFKGWRTAWVMYHIDMQQSPVGEITTLNIIPPRSVKKGSLYIDQMMYHYTINPRSPMQDAQLTFVNKDVEKAANAHWSALYAFSNTSHYLPLPIAVTMQNRQDISSITKRFKEILLTGVSLSQNKGIAGIKTEYNRWQIKRVEKRITGSPIYSMNDTELIPGSVNSKNATLPFNIKQYTQLMLQVALKYNDSEDQPEKVQLEAWFINLLDHLDDQGWAYGSGMGALHHLGYNFDGLYTACFLMKPVLVKAGLFNRTWKTMYWFSGLGRSQQKPALLPASNVDVFNTLLNGMHATILIMDDGPQKIRQLQEFSNWLSQNVKPNFAIEGAFKPDGAVFHHGTLYPAYAVGGFQGLAPVVYSLSNTSFKISSEAHRELKNAMMMMFRYTNPVHWPLSVSGRHPTGNFRIAALPFVYLAMSGLPENNNVMDTEMAGAYLTIKQNDKPDKWVKYFDDKNISPLRHPVGHWNMNYGLFDMHRRQNWLLTIRGHNRYFVSHESYPNANVFGRYLTYGHLEVLFPETKNVSGSNFKDEGWDWNHIPGTTTLNVPLDKLKADIVNVDDCSGVEEMLLSDETFAGGTTLDDQGMFAMKLHGHDKYDMGTFKAIKSWFMFDSIIICLGSNITNTIQHYPTQTTLFQNYNPSNDILYVNKKCIKVFPYQESFSDKTPLLVTDNRNISYYIPSAEGVIISTKEHVSRDQKDLRDTKGVFSKMIIDHGKAPKNGGYEYVMAIDSKRNFGMDHSFDWPTYKVLQKDSIAHSVFYSPLQITGLAIFDSAAHLNDSLISSNNKAALIMYQKNMNEVTMSVTDPDLALYTGPDDSPVINGKRKEVSIYSRSWYTTPAAPSVISIVLKGAWKKADKNSEIKTTIQPGNKTLLSVNCKYGLATKCKLVKI